MLDLRTWHFDDAGGNWIIRCKRCAAGWLPLKGDPRDGRGYDPTALIEHSLTHQRRRSRIEELTLHVGAVADNVTAVQRDLAIAINGGAPAREPLLTELEHFAIWDRMLRQELAELAQEQAAADASPRHQRVIQPGDQVWLANRSYLTRNRI